jgi:hypothetical protein
MKANISKALVLISAYNDLKFYRTVVQYFHMCLQSSNGSRWFNGNNFAPIVIRVSNTFWATTKLWNTTGLRNVSTKRSNEITNETVTSWKYEVVSKTFRTSAAIYTEVEVARSTGPNRSSCEFRVLLRSFAATAWKRTKTSPPNFGERTYLVASPGQRPVSHFRPHPAVSGNTQNGCHPPPTVLHWFGALWILPISKN